VDERWRRKGTLSLAAHESARRHCYFLRSTELARFTILRVLAARRIRVADSHIQRNRWLLRLAVSVRLSGSARLTSSSHSPEIHLAHRARPVPNDVSQSLSLCLCSLAVAGWQCGQTNALWRVNPLVVRTTVTSSAIGRADDLYPGGGRCSGGGRAHGHKR